MRGEIRTQDRGDGTGPFSTTKFMKAPGSVDGLQLIVLQLETGKKHQIRRHLSEVLALPVLNDVKYGSELIRGDKNQLGLHSAYLYTRIGNTVNKHHVPVQFGVDTLWKGFVNQEGQFSDEVKDLLENFEEKLIEVD